MDWESKNAIQKYRLNGYIDDFTTELRDDNLVSRSFIGICFSQTLRSRALQTHAMSRSTQHMLPPPLPPIIEFREVIEINPETGQEVIVQQELPPRPQPQPEPNFDIVTEAAKMPLEVAVACSLLSAAQEKMQGLANAILLVGGGAQVEGFGEALRWR